MFHNVRSEEKDNTQHCDETTGRVIARIMCYYNEKYECVTENKIKLAYACSLKMGAKVLGNEDKNNTRHEQDQIHKRTTFMHMRKEDLTETELKMAMESMTFLEQKYDGMIKDRACAVGTT